MALDTEEQKENNASPHGRIEAMIAALGTLAFLATLWLLGALGAAAFEESGAKIEAALKGRHAALSSGHLPPGRIRPRAWQRQPMRECVTWRDAA